MEAIRMDVSLSDCATTYHHAGWHPLPLPPGEKSPPPDGRTGYEGRDFTEAEVRAVLDWPNHNIGLRMPTDVIGLDIDAYHGGQDTFNELKARLGPLPNTKISHSNRNDGSGIRFYRVPVGFAWVTSLPGIEIIQRAHRYAVVWPSTHPDGRPYSWWDQDEAGPTTDVPLVEDLPELPWPWIAELSRADRADLGSHPHAASAAETQVFLDAHVTADSASYATVIAQHFTEQHRAGYARHVAMQHCLIWALEHVRAGVMAARPTVEALAGLWVDAVGDSPRRAELHSDRRTTEFEAMLRHAVGKANAKTSDELHKLHDDVAGVPMGAGASVIDVYQDDDEDAATFDPVDLKPYLSGIAIRIVPDLAVMSNGRGLLHQARLNGVHGDSGAGKSFLVDFCVREKLLKGEAVMVIDLEDTPDPLIERLRQIGVPDSSMDELLVFVRPDAAFLVEHVDRLIGHIRAREVVHVFLETMGEAFSLEGINEDRDAEVAPWLRRVCRRIIEQTGVGMTLVDHGTKSAEKPLDPSGSKRKRAAITGTAWFMQSVTPYTRDDGGLAVLICAKDRHGWYRRGEQVARLIMDPFNVIIGQTPLRLEPPSVIPPGGPQTDPLTQAAIDVITKANPTPLSLNDARAHMRRDGCKGSDNRLRQALDDAVAGGAIERFSGSNRSHMYRLRLIP
jgi:hypothetical protein